MSPSRQSSYGWRCEQCHTVWLSYLTADKCCSDPAIKPRDVDVAVYAGFAFALLMVSIFILATN